MKPASFTYHTPTSVDEAVALLDKWGPQDGRILAGGQSLVPMMAFRMAQPAQNPAQTQGEPLHECHTRCSG